uniref:Solute-binding protein family 5 domain-containing protein n=1 Tax=candidate division WOR-3 bacterium TaxID=2052148 RepID=A0A7C4Y5C2_UNCW3
MKNILLSFLFILGCVNNNKEINIVIDAPPSTLEPHSVREIPVLTILSNIYETLLGFDNNMKMTNLLAEYWEKKDSITWEFTLRKNVYFHNGKELTPEDVIYSLKRPFTIPNSEIKIYQDVIDTIYKENDRKVIIKTKKPYPLILFDISMVFIIPENYNPSKEPPCGTGPYRFEKMDEKELLLSFFNKYWGEKPDILRARFVFLRDKEKKLNLLKEGKADIVSYISFSSVDEFANYGNIITTTGLGARYLEFNLKKYPFNLKEFRYALNIGIDREKLCKEAYRGFATPANQYFPPGVFGFDISLPAIKYNPEEAKKIISRIKNIPEIVFDYSYARALIAELIAEDLKKIGLKIRKNPLQSSEFWNKIEKKESYFYIIARIPTNYDGISIISNSFYTFIPEKGKGMQNNINYSNKIVDSIIDEISKIEDEEIVEEKLHYIQNLLLEDIPKIPVVWEKDIFVTSRRIIWTPRLDKLLILKEIKLKRL